MGENRKQGPVIEGHRRPWRDSNLRTWFRKPLPTYLELVIRTTIQRVCLVTYTP
jgi:hypothetical protein